MNGYSPGNKHTLTLNELTACLFASAVTAGRYSPGNKQTLSLNELTALKPSLLENAGTIERNRRFRRHLYAVSDIRGPVSIVCMRRDLRIRLGNPLGEIL